MDTYAVIQHSLDETQNVLNQFLQDSNNIEIIDKIVHLTASVFQRRGRVFACGNGGSMCDAMHFAQEWTGRFRMDREALPALALSDAAHITCVANDFGYKEIFSRQILAFGHSKDLLIVISTSGNSENILEAVKAAKSRDITVFGLLGRGGGKVKQHCDVCLVAPGDTADRIQEIHMMVLHIVIQATEELIFDRTLKKIQFSDSCKLDKKTCC